MALLQWNCNSYDRHLTELRQLIAQYAASIVCLQETNLRPDHETVLRGFRLYSKERQDAARASGGVCTFVRSDCYSEEFPLATPLEAIAVRVSLPAMTTVCNVYLPPNQPLDINDVLDLVDQLPVPFLLVGDFNSHHPQKKGRGGLNSRDGFMSIKYRGSYTF